MTLAEYVWQNRLEDPALLVLKAPKQLDFKMQAAAAQVAALQKIARKVPAWYREGLIFPPALSMEQASSERTALFKAHLLAGKSMVDLTGGLGVDVWAFAQHFREAVYVEQDEAIWQCAAHNFGTLQLGHVQCLHMEATHFLHQNTRHFDLVYLDPARRHAHKGKVAQLADCSPNILAIKDLIFQKTDHILLKTAPMLDIHLAIKQLKQVREVWVVAYEGDCREVLYHLERQASAEPDTIPVHAVSLGRKGEKDQFFDFTPALERNAGVEYGPVSHYLYEPNAAILKSGAFRSFAARYGLQKLHPNTHLYTSVVLVPDIPGRCFEVSGVAKYDRKAVQALVPQRKAHIAARNFPDTPDQLRKKLGLLDGGDVYLFACTDMEGKKVVAGRLK
jgi:16S rRNA G966 N2-methylase RsmD